MEKVIRASLDRIEGDFAVVYSDHDGHNNNKFDVPLELVKGAKPGMRLQLHIENDQINHIEIDKEATEGSKRQNSQEIQKAAERSPFEATIE